MSRFVILSTFFGAFLCSSSLTWAVDYFWVNPAGGAFGTAVNWQPFDIMPPVIRLGPGDGDDTVNFDLGMSPDQRYAVNGVSGENDRLLVHNDSLSLFLSDDYSLLSFGINPPSMVVGVANGDDADVIVAGSFLGGESNLLETQQMILGQSAGSTGALTVSNLRWNADERLVVGDSGQGTLEIVGDSNVSSTIGGTIARESGSSGTVIVSDDSNWSVGILGGVNVGFQGDGTLIVSDGGSVSGGVGGIAGSAGSTGNVTVTGADSNWTLDHDIYIGEGGAAQLTIEAGGSVEHPLGGYIDGNDSTVTVTGSGSSWTVGAGLFTGMGGDVALAVTDGGSVSSDEGWIGYFAEGYGTVTVSGAGSAWTTSSEFHVGREGGADLMIADGGDIINDGPAFIGTESTSIATVTVTGAGSTWTVGNSLAVGNFGIGALTIERGGTVTCLASSIGRFADSGGTVTVRGAGSTWTAADFINVGFLDVGTLIIEDGGSVTTENAAIGRGTSGSVTVTGTDSSWTMTGGLGIGGNLVGQNGGTGTLSIGARSSVSVGEAIHLHPDGLLTLEGGSLTAATITFLGGGQFDWTGGTLRVDRFDGNLVNEAGTLAPAALTSSTTVTGNYTQEAAGTLAIEIGGLFEGESDQLLVNGNAILEGTLDVSLINDFQPVLGNEFTIIETTVGNVQGPFDAAILPVFDELTFDVIYNTKSVVLTVVEALPGDYNDDGTVDAADYAMYRDNWGAPAGSLPNDTEGGVIGQTQYDTWVANFGAELGSGANDAAVPEPGTLATMLVLGMVFASRFLLRRSYLPQLLAKMVGLLRRCR